MDAIRTSALNSLLELADSVSNQAVLNWKNQGKPVVGYLCTYIPEEIFCAADILPFRIGARGCRGTVLADTLMPTITCSFCRSCLEFAMRGDYNFLDGLVYMNGCENMRRMADNWRHRAPAKFTHFMSVPQKADRYAMAWYKEELGILRQNLETIFGVKITNERLRESVQLCNQTRQLLNKLYELQRRQNPVLTGVNVQKIVIMANAMPKQEYNKLLEETINEATETNGISNYKFRMMVVGNMLDDCSYTEVIEDCGGLVVTDASCFGSLSFWEPVELTDDPLDGLVKAYLNGISCPRQPHKQRELANFINKMVRDYHVEGIIFERMIHCCVWATETLSIEKNSHDFPVPLLILDREYLPSGIGQLKTRLQAFLEVIGSGK